MTAAEPGAPACDAVRFELEPFLDGELAADRAAAVEAHLDECASCAAAAVYGRAYRRAMAAAGRSAAPESLRARLRRVIAGGAGESPTH